MPAATLPPARPARPPAPLTAALPSLALLVFLTLGLSQLISTSPTFDEGYTLLRGYAALRTGHLIPIGHPPLAHWLSALGVLLEPNLPDPRDLRGWYGDKYDESSRDLLWERGLNTTRLVFLGRLPILLLGLVLGAVTARWARDLLGWPGALAAAGLHALSPNLLANSAVATTDLPVAAFYVLSLYAWYRFTRRPAWANAALLGVSLGAALASKFSALLLLPTLGLLGLIYLADLFRRWPPQPARLLISISLRAGLAVVAALVTVWAVYGFASQPYPLAQYSRELFSLGSLAGEGHTAYLLGQLSLKGWWYYHPVVLFVKTPLPLLALLLIGAAALLRGPGRARRLLIYAGLPAAVYLTAVTLSSLNVGYRYLLPALPLLHILAAAAVTGAASLTRRLSVGALFAWHLAATLLIAPHFIAYFNELVGPAQGYMVLADSNLDWGQDLPGLAHYLNGRAVYLSYFGQADPAYYGIHALALPAWPPPDRSDFVPADPAPGLYAISASDLVGVQMTDPNTFAAFRRLQPVAVINYSIFVYEAPARPEVKALVQCRPPQLDPAAVNHLFNGRAVRGAVIDCADSLLLPAQPGLALLPSGQTPLVDLGSSVFDWVRADGSVYYRLYRVQAPADAAVQVPGRYLSLLDYTLTPQALTIRWRVETPAPPPVSIFVHFNWSDGALADAYDALGAPAEFWQAGDVIIQRHAIAPDLPPGKYGVEVGLYSLADGTRYSDIQLTTFSK